MPILPVASEDPTSIAADATPERMETKDGQRKLNVPGLSFSIYFQSGGHGSLASELVARSSKCVLYIC